MKATWKGAVLADSNDIIMIEGNAYFPASALDRSVVRPSQTHTTCPWKGVASYYDVVVGNDVNRDAVWFYPEPSDKAMSILNRVAFWRGVEVH